MTNKDALNYLSVSFLLLVVAISIFSIVLFLISHSPTLKHITLQSVHTIAPNNIHAIGTKFTKSNRLIDLIYNNMTTAERRGALMMVGIPDTVLSENTINFLNTYNIGGVLIMGYNIESEQQLKKLISDIRNKVNKDTLIAIDQEGGTVVRINWDEYKDISAREIGQSGDLKMAYNIAKYRAKLLSNLGINIILGPVADIGYSKNDFLFDRSFGSDPKTVATFVESTVKGYKDGGIISSLKHFPGHGRTVIDSHFTIPTINLTRDILETEEWVPFYKGINAGVEMIMTGHIINPNISKYPASISHEYLDILNDMHFNGVIITDDLSMSNGIEGNINYGINLTLEPQEKVIERLHSLQPIEKYVKRVINLRTMR